MKYYNPGLQYPLEHDEYSKINIRSIMRQSPTSTSMYKASQDHFKLSKMEKHQTIQ